MLRSNIVPDNKAWIQWRTCKRKKSFTSISKANKTINNYHSNDKSIHVYECPYCYSFHIGHKEKK